MRKNHYFLLSKELDNEHVLVLFMFIFNLNVFLALKYFFSHDHIARGLSTQFTRILQEGRRRDFHDLQRGARYENLTHYFGRSHIIYKKGRPQ